MSSTPTARSDMSGCTCDAGEATTFSGLSSGGTQASVVGASSCPVLDDRDASRCKPVAVSEALVSMQPSFWLRLATASTEVARISAAVATTSD